MIIQYKTAKKLAGISILIAAVPVMLFVLFGSIVPTINDVSEVSFGEAVISFGADLFSFIIGVGFFFVVPMMPAFFAYFVPVPYLAPNPLYAVGPALSYVAWFSYMLIYLREDAFAPVILVFYGLPSALLVCLLTYVVFKILGVKVTEKPAKKDAVITNS
ncbi:hypothetical protein [Kordiimonas sp. SCSIO 12610]|uniref:hypothetical protein n=1 Tax=Kordiimonas sp. SCSIO 12610 TaxID=2829597 RepID=UPI00210C1360|nr:hypothetical protein [Kordiimonas sp. SCSIO 12610]UTW56169.1 hypothetical protein KFF44_04535 [Kordiimonas sp. SCSIO 12610]